MDSISPEVQELIDETTFRVRIQDYEYSIWGGAVQDREGLHVINT